MLFAFTGRKNLLPKASIVCIKQRKCRKKSSSSTRNLSSSIARRLFEDSDKSHLRQRGRTRADKEISHRVLKLLPKRTLWEWKTWNGLRSWKKKTSERKIIMAKLLSWSFNIVLKSDSFAVGARMISIRRDLKRPRGWAESLLWFFSDFLFGNFNKKKKSQEKKSLILTDEEKRLDMFGCVDFLIEWSEVVAGRKEGNWIFFLFKSDLIGSFSIINVNKSSRVNF